MCAWPSPIERPDRVSASRSRCCSLRTAGHTFSPLSGCLSVQSLETLPGLNHIIAIAGLRKVGDDHLKHLSCKGPMSPFLSDLTGTKGTGRSHRRWIRREADVRSAGRRFLTLRGGYGISSGVRHVPGESQSLCIDTHRIKVSASGAVGVDPPHIHKAAIVSEQRC
jgi:hypothetical protein